MKYSFDDKVSLKNFSIEGLDISDIENATKLLPKGLVLDVNIAEQGLISTLHAQNTCQELITKVEYFISIKENEKNKAWATAALTKADEFGHKAVKNREWFAMGDDSFIEACNQLAKAKALKKWLENKASNFYSWHHAFKSFLKRDYSLEHDAQVPFSKPDDVLTDTQFAADPFAASDDS